jgi:cytochrome bd-type quinol oxidase subunit 2
MVQERNAVVVVLLCLVTCGIYFLYWVYKTSDELRQALSEESINPALDLLLTMVTCYIWAIYVHHRNSQHAHRILAARDPWHIDQTQTILILCIAQLVVGVTGLIATYLLQEELNRVARLTR